MAALNDQNKVRTQYATSGRLNNRISLHAKYSVNKQGFGPWIASHYQFPPGASVLELGCGTGEMWLGQEKLINSCSRLVLSDFSGGMLAKAKETLKAYPAIRFEIIDIAAIPFPDRSFDAVIANMMLYHVPDIGKALREVRRVLKDGGAFYCATYGEHGIMEYLCSLFPGAGAEDEVNHTFTLQNGAARLRAVFSRVERFDYADALAVTDVQDLADYIASLTGMSGLKALPREQVVATLTAHMRDGILTVPKEYGLFVCR